MASTISSAPTAATSAAVAAVPRATSTPSASSRRPYHASRSVIWPRDGCRPASRNWPPSSVPASRSVTRWPRSAATRAASRPAGPPPTTSTCRAVAAGVEPIAAPLELAAGGWIHQARDPVVARAPSPAHLVARDARPDVLGAVGAGLGDQVRIGDLAAHDADQVGLTAGEHGFRGLGGADVALGLHQGVRDDALELGGERDAQLLLVQRDRDDRVEVEVRARAAGHVVHRLSLVVPGDDLGQLGHRQGRGRSLVHAHGQADDEVVAAGARGSARGSSPRSACAPRTSHPSRPFGGSTTASRTGRPGRGRRRRSRPRRSRRPGRVARSRRTRR